MCEFATLSLHTSESSFDGSKAASPKPCQLLQEDASACKKGQSSESVREPLAVVCDYNPSNICQGSFVWASAEAHFQISVLQGVLGNFYVQTKPTPH